MEMKNGLQAWKKRRSAAAAARATEKKKRISCERIRTFPRHLLRCSSCSILRVDVSQSLGGTEVEMPSIQALRTRPDRLAPTSPSQDDRRPTTCSLTSTSTSLLLSFSPFLNPRKPKNRTAKRTPRAPRDQEVQQVPQAPHRAQGDQVEENKGETPGAFVLLRQTAGCFILSQNLELVPFAN